MLSRPAAVLTLIAAAAAATAHARAREEVTRNFDRTVPLTAGKALDVTHRHGNIQVKTHARPEVRIHGTIRASADTRAEAEEFLKRIEIEIQEVAAGVTLRTVYPMRGRDRRNASFSVEYDLLMPDSAPLTVRNSFGDVLVAGLKASAVIVNSHGRLSLSDGRGDARLENKFGAVEVARLAGNATVSNANGAVTVTALDGQLTLSNRFGDVIARQVRKTSSIVNANGKVELTDAVGPASVTSSFGAVVVVGVKGDLKVGNQNGAVDARGVTGNADLSSSFGDISFADIAQALTITGANGRVTGSKVGGPLRVRNSFGDVTVGDVGGDLDVHNSNGAVRVQDIRGGAILRTSFGRIEARGARQGVKAFGGNGDVIVADTPGAVFIKTSFGLAQADRVGPLTVENQNGAVRASAVKGPADLGTSFAAVVLSGVQGTVAVRNQNGSIEVSGVSGGQACPRMRLTTSFAPIRLALPEGIGFTVSARTSFGRIQSDLPLTTTGPISGDSVSGTLAGGGCDVTVTNSNGDITLQKGLAGR